MKLASDRLVAMVYLGGTQIVTYPPFLDPQDQS